jgi:hypothetical protein
LLTLSPILSENSVYLGVEHPDDYEDENKNTADEAGEVYEKQLMKNFYLHQTGSTPGVNSEGKDYSLRLSPLPGTKIAYFISNISLESRIEKIGSPAEITKGSLKKKKKLITLDIFMGDWSVDGNRIILKNIRKPKGLNKRMKFGFDLFYEGKLLHILYTSYPGGRLKIYEAVSDDGINFKELGRVVKLNSKGTNTGHVSTNNDGSVLVYEVDYQIYITRRKNKKWTSIKKLALKNLGKNEGHMMPDFYQEGDTIYLFYRNVFSDVYAAKIEDMKVVAVSKVDVKGRATKYISFSQNISNISTAVFGSLYKDPKKGQNEDYEIYQFNFGEQ